MTAIGKTPCDEAIMRLGAPAQAVSVATRRWVLVAAILGSSMAFIDGTVVNVALPAIQRELHATAFDAQWVVEAYALFLAALLLVGGSLGDRFGRRRVFMLGVALFTLASVCCALAGDVRALIAARALQGAGGALLVPGSLALISAAYAQAERGRAIGTWSGFSGITAALGPVLGGYLVDHYSWAWAFLINLPLGIAVLAIAATRVPESLGTGGRAGLDAWGALLATLALGGVVYAFIEAPVRGWGSPAVWVALLLGLAAGVLFVRVERASAAPMLPLALFARRNFSGANLLTLLLYAALGGGLFFLPLNLIQVQGYSATAAGAALLPFVLLLFMLSSWAGELALRVGSRLPLVAGPVVAATGFGLFALPGIGGSYWLGFFPAVAVLGLGMAITIAPLTTTVMNAVGPEQAGVASGVNNAVSRVAGLLAIAVFGMLLAAVFEASLREQLARLGLPADISAEVLGQRSKLAGAVLPAQIGPADAEALKRVIGTAFVAGFRWVMALSAGLALLGALVAWVMVEARPRQAGP